MFEQIDNLEAPKGPKKKGAWASMNFIQRGGVIGSFLLVPFSFILQGQTAMAFGLVGWTTLVMGYIAGNLWKCRHALHFWWSALTAFLVHCSLLPVYAYLVRQIRDSHDGKVYLQLSVFLVSVEVIVLLVLLRKFAMWLHRRNHSSRPMEAA